MKKNCKMAAMAGAAKSKLKDLDAKADRMAMLKAMSAKKKK